MLHSFIIIKLDRPAFNAAR